MKKILKSKLSLQRTTIRSLTKMDAVVGGAAAVTNTDEMGGCLCCTQVTCGTCGTFGGTGLCC